MIQNFLKVIARFILRSKFFTLINVAGLSLGLACTLVIYLYIRHEYSFDQFHNDGHVTYRVVREAQMNNVPYHVGVTSGPFMEALVTDYPGQITEATRAMPADALVQIADESFIEDRVLLADSNFFSFFSYPLLHGDPRSVLTNPNAVVLTKAFARKYFGDQDPVGKTLRLDNQYDLTVTGVMDDMPGNTHLQFDLVSSLQLVTHEDWFNEWWNNSLYTYVKIPEAKNVAYLGDHLDEFMDKYFGEDFKRTGSRMNLVLEPLQEIYFNSDTRFETNVKHGDKKYIAIFASVGILLVLLAAINYMNLATAQASRRAKEVGIRKTLGSSRKAIALQFLSESAVLCGISIVLAMVIAQMAIPVLGSAFHIELSSFLSDTYVWVFLAALWVVISLASGAYPALMLSTFQAVKVLKGEVKGEWRYVLVRKALVVFQFGISIFMIVATLFIGRQLQYMHNKDLGFDREKVMIISINNGVVGEQRQVFKNQVLNQAGVVSASFMTGHPGGFHDATSVDVEGSPDPVRMRTLWTDEDFTQTLNIDLVAGRAFSKAYPSDEASAAMINETAARQLGWTPQEAIGKRLRASFFDETFKEIIGVVGDYHFLSLHDQIEPLIVMNGSRRELAVKLSNDDTRGVVAGIEQVWNGFDSGYPMDWFFLDDDVDQLYRKEQVQSKLFSVFSFVSVFIACLGIFGLTSYIAAQRRKEIGIRKILGATSRQLSYLLVKDMLVLVLVSNVVAMPVGYWAIKNWLQGFAYRIEMAPLVFIAGAMAVLLAAGLIVGLRAMATAAEDPARALRTE
ncbi:MAG: FtsX-like permease family protein [Bacteroidia bacterium]|nr:FtsX-like permease family protein [Bacteroidia bacterium]